MATPPDFTTGAILTAAQMNAVGLWLVKTQTVGTAVPSVTVTDAFSADYDNYRITYTGGVGSTSTFIRVTVGASVTGYYNTLVYGTFSTTLVNANVNDNNNVHWSFVGAGSTDAARLVMELQNPFLTTRTFMSPSYSDPGNGGSSNGYLGDSSSHTSFTISPNAGTLTGGTIRVYGYRN
jgi:hypothetical protein